MTVACPCCSHQVSRRARACPNCGDPFESTPGTYQCHHCYGSGSNYITNMMFYLHEHLRDKRDTLLLGGKPLREWDEARAHGYTVYGYGDCFNCKGSGLVRDPDPTPGKKECSICNGRGGKIGDFLTGRENGFFSGGYTYNIGSEWMKCTACEGRGHTWV